MFQLFKGHLQAEYTQYLWNCNIHVPFSVSIQPEDGFLRSQNMLLVIV